MKTKKENILEMMKLAREVNATMTAEWAMETNNRKGDTLTADVKRIRKIMGNLNEIINREKWDTKNGGTQNTSTKKQE